MTELQMEAIVSPVEGLVVYCLDCDPKGLYFHNGVGFLDVINQVPSGVPFVTSAAGRIWMDRNLGATQVATSSTDAASYGDLYQWGRYTDGHQIAANGTNTPASGVISIKATSTSPPHGNFITGSNWLNTQDDTLWQGVNGVNNPCPNNFRIPTIAEWIIERNTWSPFNEIGALNSPLAVPTASNRNNFNGNLNVGQGYYWSSTVNAGSIDYLYVNSSSLNPSIFSRAVGASVRCIRD